MTPERWQQIDRLFHEALACEPAQRAAFLANACAGDEPLRLEVESLISSHESGESFIETPAGDVAAEMLGTHKPTLEPGHQIDNYKIVRELGAGGMGEVYLANDTTLNRKIALKLLPSSYTNDSDRVRRFEQEARAASALNHPNIVTIHEIGETDSLHFIATEFVDGKTLRECMTNTRMTVGDVMDVGAQVASALQSAHEAGIVHRDIKPENVMLRHDRVVKVLDFGLAKLTPQRLLTAADHGPTNFMVQTNPGVVMGTVTYMSPEQARGQKVDARTDIWSLGVVLYEMVAGRAPFTGETPSHVIVSILENELRSLAADSGVPAELERIISKSLRKDPVERYQAASDMALDLKNLKEDLTIEIRLKQLQGSPDRDDKIDGQAAFDTAEAAAARTSELFGTLFGTHSMSSGEYFLDAIKRHRGSAAFASVAGLLLIASLVYFTNFTRGRSETKYSVAVLISPHRTMQSIMPKIDDTPKTVITKSFADAISAEFTGPLSRLPNVQVISVNADNYNGKQIDALAIGRELNVSAVLLVQVEMRGDKEKRLEMDAELSDVRNNRRMWSDASVSSPAQNLSMLKGWAEQIAAKLYLELRRSEKGKSD